MSVQLMIAFILATLVNMFTLALLFMKIELKI